MTLRAWTFGLAQSRESLRALRLRIHLGGVRCYCGIFSAELAWRVSTRETELSKALPSVRGVARHRGAVRCRAPAPGAVHACWRGAGRRYGGAGGNVPVFSLINDAHAAARGSCALSLAVGLAENSQENAWHRARQAHPTGPGAPTRSTLASPSGRETPVPIGTQPRPSPGCGRSGDWSLQPDQLRGHMPHSLFLAPERRPDAARAAERSQAPPPATVPAAWEGRAGQRVRQRRRGDRGRGTGGRTEAGWLWVGLTE